MFSRFWRISIFLLLVCSVGYAEKQKNWKVIDESGRKAVVEDVIPIDKVWAGHPVGFSLLTRDSRQFIAYYNAQRRMIAGMRMLDDKNWTLFELKSKMDRPPSYKAGETSTILGWDSHNSVTLVVDKEGFIHLSGNMHCNGLTYFRSQKPYDVTTLVQVDEMVGEYEDRCTYPRFIVKPDGALLFHYRYGKSGSGNEIYNIYDVNTRKWSRFLDAPLTDGTSRDINAYMSGPEIGPDGWYHLSWVWRDTFDAATNHDLSYMKSPDLINWYDVSGKKLNLPVTIDTNNLIVDPIPAHGGIINGSGKVGFDNQGRVVLAYHKFDEKGNTQAYCARYEDGNWKIYKLTDWDYRWDFGGGGSIQFEVRLGAVKARNDGMLELDYSNKKYGSGCWLLNEELTICGEVIKSDELPKSVRKAGSDFPGMSVRTLADSGDSGQDNVAYFLRWETLGQNRDRPREGKLPQASQLSLYKIRYHNN